MTYPRGRGGVDVTALKIRFDQGQSSLGQKCVSGIPADSYISLLPNPLPNMVPTAAPRPIKLPPNHLPPLYSFIPPRLSSSLKWTPSYREMYTGTCVF
ncbi:hypothetical protein XENTR_v10004528 [Xenopus tropicalis]|nr:hypothetical protein XENTR_v10004528 [Xenopus tropicalis]